MGSILWTVTAAPLRNSDVEAKTGAVKILARGLYTAMPDTVDTETWMPPLNDAAMLLQSQAMSPGPRC